VDKYQISKINEEQNLVFGFAYVSIEKDGQQVVDHSDEIIDPEDLEKAAYLFNLVYRESGVMHKGDPVGYLVESLAITPDKLEAMGLEKDSLPQGWWLGFHIPDNDIFKRVKNRELSMFSIQGTATREGGE
jgi:hypothetical protein